MRSPGEGMTRRKCAPAAQMLTPPANRPLVHGSDMHECRMVATLPTSSTTVTWLLPGGGTGSSGLGELGVHLEEIEAQACVLLRQQGLERQVVATRIVLLRSVAIDRRHDARHLVERLGRLGRRPHVLQVE